MRRNRNSWVGGSASWCSRIYLVSSTHKSHHWDSYQSLVETSQMMSQGDCHDAQVASFQTTHVPKKIRVCCWITGLHVMMQFPAFIPRLSSLWYLIGTCPTIAMSLDMTFTLRIGFLIYSLHLRCSYQEVHQFKRSAALSYGTDIPNFISQSVQYVADNVDHNIWTLDGNDTFHGDSCRNSWNQEEQPTLHSPCHPLAWKGMKWWQVSLSMIWKDTLSTWSQSCHTFYR